MTFCDWNGSSKRTSAASPEHTSLRASGNGLRQQVLRPHQIVDVKIPWSLLGASVYGIVWLVEASCSIFKLNIFNVMSLSLVRGSFSWLWGRLPWSMQQRIRRQKSRLVDTRMKSCSGHESCRTYGTHPCNEAQRCIIDFYFITEIVSSLSLVLLLRFIRQQMGAGEQETDEKEDWGSKK